MKKNVKKKQRLLVTAIIIVSVLLLINLFLLYLLLDDHISTSRINNNYIGETQQIALPSGRAAYLRSDAIPLGLFTSNQSRAEEKLSLTFWNSHKESENFDVDNMFPGDSKTKKYTVTVRSREASAIVFDIDIKKDSFLSSKLILTVVANGKVLYDDFLSKMSPLSVDLKSGKAAQEVVYEITATLPIWADNSVANLSLSVDFLWLLTEKVPSDTSDDDDPFPWEPDQPGLTETTVPSPSETENPPPETTSPVTETEPPETLPEPPETETEPPETLPEPPETDPPETKPTVPGDDCNPCIIDKIIERFTGQSDERCPICDAVDFVFKTEDICICPYGCLLVLILIVLTVLLTILTILYFIFKRRAKEEEEEEEEELAEDMTDTDNDFDNQQ